MSYRVRVDACGATEPAIAYGAPAVSREFPLPAFAGTSFAGVT
jgi:hypothetical protein